MKIAILTSAFFQKVEEVDGKDSVIYGGAERYLIELCHWLEETGNEVTVFQAVNSKAKTLIQKEFMGVHFVGIPTEDKWDYFTAPNLNLSFYEMSLSYDLRIYFATFLAYPQIKSPSIVISHGIFWDNVGGHLTIYNEAERQEFFKRQMWCITTPDLCVSVDTNVRNSIATMYPGEERNIMVIPNFVDTKTFYPREKEIDWEKPRILFPRRLSNQRGVNEFLVSASQLPNYDFYLCGQSADESAEEQFNPYSDRNIKMTMYPMSDMEKIYKEMDIAVIPTRASEGTSLSCLEAMASGLPIITTPVGGLPNLVIDGYNGIVVDLNHDSLTNAIKKLAEDKSLRHKFGERNLQIVQDSFSIEIWKEKWAKAINKVIK